MTTSHPRPRPTVPLTAALTLALALHAAASDPIFQASDLLGAQTDGIRIRVVNSGSGVSNIDIGETVLASGSLPGNAGGLFSTVNFGGPGSFPGKVPYPTGTNADNFGFEATGLLNIPAAGSYVFGVNSDDGFRLRLGADFATLSQFFGSTGNSNTRVVVTFDQPGLVPYRLTHFEAGGGEFIEFYAKPGTNTALDLTADRLVGDTANGGLQSIAAGQFFVRDVKSPGTVGNLAAADALLRGTVTPTLETNAFSSYVDFLDGGGGANYPNNLPFPGGAGRDDFALEATAMVYIPAAGTYTFGSNTDDGSRIQVQGQRVLNFDRLGSPANAFGTTTFDAPGFYDLRYLFFERSGGAGAELFVAHGTHTTFDANQFRLVGDVANGGLAVFSPKGWKHDAGGTFSDANNWRDGQVAGGSGAFATFSIVDLTADRTVTLDAAHTLGHLRLGDIDATGGAHGWIFSGPGSLNLASSTSTPAIEVLNGRSTINTTLTGTDGLAKLGAGTLAIASPATLSGEIQVRQGTLALATSDALPTSSSLSLGHDGQAGTFALEGHSQTLAQLSTTGTAGTANRVVNGTPTQGHLTLDIAPGTTNRFDGTLGGTTADQNNFQLTKQGGGTLRLTTPHSYSGTTTIADGTIALGITHDVAGAALWLDAANPSSHVASGTQLDAWLDQSGNGRTATAIGTTKPTISSNALVNNADVIRFNGTNQSLAVDLSFLANSDYTIFALEGRTGNGNHYFLGTNSASSTNNALHIGYRNNTQYTLAQFGNDLNFTVPGYTSQDFRIWANQFDSSSGHAIYLDGALAISNTNTAPLTGAANGRVGTGNGTQWFNGDLAEILIFNRSLSATERQQVEAYLSEKWFQAPAISPDILPSQTALRIAASGTLNLNGISQTVASLSDHAGAGGTIRNTSGGAATFTTGTDGTDQSFSGTISDLAATPLSFSKQGTGTQTLSGAGISYHGTTTVAGGTLRLEDTTNFGQGKLAAPTVQLANNATIEFDLSSGNSLQLGNSAQAAITGDGHLVKSGAGALTLSGQQSYSGNTTIAGGTLRLASAPGVADAALWLDAAANHSISLSGTTVTSWADRSGNGRDASPAATGPQSLANPLANDHNVLRFANNNALNVDLSFLAGSEYTIFALEGRTGTGNHYFLGTNSANSTNNALHIGYRNNTQYTLAQYSNDLNYNLPAFSGQDFRIWANQLDFSSGHAIYLDGSLAASNANTAPLTGAANGRVGNGFLAGQWYNGDIAEILIFDRSLSAAERQQVEAYLATKWDGAGFSNVLPAGTDLALASGATLDLNGIHQTIASLSDHAGGGGTITNSASAPTTLTIDGSTDASFSGDISDGPSGGTISLVKAGTSTQSLSGALTYSGDTAVLNGTLLINGTLFPTGGSPSLTVSSGAILGGNGTIGHASTPVDVTILSGGTLSPGNSPDTLNIFGDLTLDPGAIYLVDLAIGGSTAPGNGLTGTDRTTITGGTVTLDGALLQGTWGGNQDNIFAGTLNSSNMLWIITGADDIVGTFANSYASSALDSLFGTTNEAYWVSVAGRPFAAFYNSQVDTLNLIGGNDLLLIAIPEPSRPLLLAIALTPLLLRRRRR
jgi:autotransporter-associated beta strand protein